MKHGDGPQLFHLGHDMVDVPSITIYVPSADLHLWIKYRRDTNARSATGRRAIAYQRHDSIDNLTWKCQESRFRTQPRANAWRPRLTARVPRRLTTFASAELVHENLITTSISLPEIARIPYQKFDS